MPSLEAFCGGETGGTRCDAEHFFEGEPVS